MNQSRTEPTGERASQQPPAGQERNESGGDQ